MSYDLISLPSAIIFLNTAVSDIADVRSTVPVTFSTTKKSGSVSPTFSGASSAKFSLYSLSVFVVTPYLYMSTYWSLKSLTTLNILCHSSGTAYMYDFAGMLAAYAATFLP